MTADSSFFQADQMLLCSSTIFLTSYSGGGGEAVDHDVNHAEAVGDCSVGVGQHGKL